MNHEENLKIEAAATKGSWYVSNEITVGGGMSGVCRCQYSVGNDNNNAKFIAHTKDPEDGYAAYIKRVIKLEKQIEILEADIAGRDEFLELAFDAHPNLDIDVEAQRELLK